MYASKEEEVCCEMMSSGQERTFVVMTNNCDSVKQTYTRSIFCQNSRVDGKEPHEAPHLAEELLAVIGY